jgi:hypothetical protein
MIGEAMVVATVPVTDLARSKAFYGGAPGSDLPLGEPRFCPLSLR